MLPLESSPRPQFRPCFPRSATATIPTASTLSSFKALFASADLPGTCLPSRSRSRCKLAATVPLTDFDVFHRNALDA